MSEEYISFDKVLRELQIEEDELKKLVSAGEIKAFRDAEKMKFKKEEIDALKQRKTSDPDVIELLDSEDDLGKGSEPTLDATLEGGAEITEELSFEDDDLDAELGMATEQIQADDLLEEPAPVKKSIAAQEEEEVELGSMDLEEEEIEPAAKGRRKRAPAPGALVKKTRIAGLAEEAEEETEPQWALALMIVSTVCLLLGMIVMTDIASSAPSPLVGWLVGMFGG